ncbi:hypothetical protein ABZV81_23410 [Streptomyces parvus]|uniref:hypothetical protein n=1 Tax=Streptomyces parvus TaxID=66428 RepID=UPI0033A33921
MATSKKLSATLAGAPVTIHGDGTQTRDFTYVGTVCHVLIDALFRRVVDPRPVNLAFGSRISLLGLIPEIETATGCRAWRENGYDRTGDVHHSQADSTRVQTLFPVVTPVPIQEGIAATVHWFRAVTATMTSS